MKRRKCRCLKTGSMQAIYWQPQKTMVRNYSIAITETATPELREVLLKQLNGAVRWHEQVYNYMARRGLYPSYDLGKLLQGDVFRAQKAISMKY